MRANPVVGTGIDAHANEEAKLPFDSLAPNAETVEAMRAARCGELVSLGGIEDLLPDLHSND